MLRSCCVLMMHPPSSPPTPVPSFVCIFSAFIPAKRETGLCKESHVNVQTERPPVVKLKIALTYR